MKKWNGNFLDDTSNNYRFTEGAIPFLQLGNELIKWTQREGSKI
jgi:hypothetical protein